MYSPYIIYSVYFNYSLTTFSVSCNNQSISSSVFPSWLLPSSSLIQTNNKRISFYVGVLLKAFCSCFINFFVCFDIDFRYLFIVFIYACSDVVYISQKESCSRSKVLLFFFFLKLHFFLNSTYTQLLQSKCGTNMKLARPQTKPFSR